MILLQKRISILSILLGMLLLLNPIIVHSAEEETVDLIIDAQINIPEGSVLTPDQKLTFTIDYQNKGPDDATGVIVESFYGDFLENPTGYPSICDNTGKSIRCEIGEFKSGESGSFRYSVAVKRGSISEYKKLYSLISAREPREISNGNNSDEIQLYLEGTRINDTKYYVPGYYDHYRAPETLVTYYDEEFVEEVQPSGKTSGSSNTPSSTTNNTTTNTSSTSSTTSGSNTQSNTAGSSTTTTAPLPSGSVALSLKTSKSTVLSGDGVSFTGIITNTSDTTYRNLTAENYFPINDFNILSTNENYSRVNGDQLIFTKSRLIPGESWKIQIIAQAKPKTGDIAIRVVDHLLITAENVNIRNNFISTGLFLSPSKEFTGEIITNVTPNITTTEPSGAYANNTYISGVPRNSGSGSSVWIPLLFAIFLSIGLYYTRQKKYAKESITIIE